MISAFNENFKAPHVAPEYGNDGATDFDYDAVSRALGESDADQPRGLQDASTAFAKMVQQVILPYEDLRRKRAAEMIGLRLIAAAWVINPANFGGLSLAELSRRLGISAATLATYSGEFSRTFGFRNHAQSHYKPGTRNGDSP